MMTFRSGQDKKKRDKKEVGKPWHDRITRLETRRIRKQPGAEVRWKRRKAK